MNIELKNIHHYPRMSEETEAFVADIFIDGQKIGYAKNEGHGGNTDYRGYNAKTNEILRQADEYCKTLPPKIYDDKDGSEPLTIDMNLENFIDNLFYEYLDNKDKLKFERAREKAMNDRLVIGINDNEYGTIKLSKPVNELLQFEQGEEYLKNMIAKHLAPKIKEGHRLLNNNIPEKIFRDAGLKENQFVPNQLKTIAENREERRQMKKKTNRLK